MSDKQGPDDPFKNPLAMGAASIHELFLAYREVGFTVDEALRLIAYVIANQGGTNG